MRIPLSGLLAISLFCSPALAQGSLSISGKIFLDASEDGLLQAGEPGLPDILVELYDAGGTLIDSYTTALGGNYSFGSLAAGGYLVEVPSASGGAASNEDLADYFQATAGNSMTVNLQSSNAKGVDFGFTLDCQELLLDFDPSDPDMDGRVFLGKGKTIGYWKHQLSVAITGKGKAQVSASDLQAFLDEMETGRLSRPPYRFDPYQFDDLDEFGDAYAYLSSTSSHEIDLLHKQLVAAELNVVSGCGLTNHFMVQTGSIALGEYMVANPGLFSREQVLCIKDVLDSMNNLGE